MGAESRANLPRRITNPAGAFLEVSVRLIYPYDGKQKRAAILAIARKCVGGLLPRQDDIGRMIGARQPIVAYHIEKLREAGLLWLRRIIHRGVWRFKVERVA